jgi:4-amino-4-deoxy-L-arabinose transferase-like glycosyltransferase
MPRRLLLPVLLFLAVCPYFIDLDGSSIWDANEAFYVETPREMMERGDYIFPTFNYEPRINKPVLSYWIVAAFYHVFGVSPGVQRIPIAVGGIVLIVVAFFLARAAAPVGAQRDAGWWAALGLAVSPRLVMFARRIFIDIYISAFMALTLLFFALAERYPERRRLLLIAMYVSAGLGVLTKGPIAALLPGLVFGVYLLWHRELGRVRQMLLPLGALIVLAIVVPWYAALYSRAGWEPIASFLFGENVARYVEGLGVNADHRGLFWYVPVVFTDSFPLSLMLLPAAVMWWRQRRAGVIDAPSRIRTLLWIWILTIVGFFSLSAGKQDLYVFPIVPAIAALAGVVITRALASDATAELRPFVRGILIAAGILIVAFGGGFFTLFYSRYAIYILAGSAIVGIGAMAGGATAAGLALRRRLSAALVVVVSTLVVVNWIFVLKILPSFEAYKPAPGLAKAIEERAAPSDLIVTYNVALPSLVYYLRRHIEVFYDHGPVLELLSSRRPLYLMVTADDYERAIQPNVTEPLCRVSSQPTFDVKLKNVLSRRRLPEVWLLTNKCDSRQSLVVNR